jgi:hypothetical protein
MNANQAAALDSVVFHPKDSGCINYVKARIVIEETLTCRTDKRNAKMAVIEHLKGALLHPSDAEVKHGMKKLVVFPDNTKARF